MDGNTDLLDEWAGVTALRLIAWLDARVEESRRPWIAALAAETHEMERGWERLRWALSGLTLAWTFRKPPALQTRALGFWKATFDRNLLRRHRSDVAAIALAALLVVLLGYVVIPGVVLFGPFAASLLLLARARTLRGWRRATAGLVAMSGLCGATYQIWVPFAAESAGSRVLFAGAPAKRAGFTVPLKDAGSLTHRARRAWASRDTSGARVYATLLLEQLPRMAGSDDFGQAIHDGNILLGRVAYAGGDYAEAKRRLYAAGASPGSGALRAFGPSMALARDLLKVGQRDAVLVYLRQSRAIWKYDRGALARWEAQVQLGQMPQFGTNASY